MDQVLSELIRSWGTFGLIVVVLGFIIWEKFIKKDSNQEKQSQNHDVIFTSLLDIKDKNEPWFSPSVYPGMVHAISEKWHKYEFYPITDIIDKSYRLYIKLKNFYY